MMTLELGSRVTPNSAQEGRGILNHPAHSEVVSLASADIVTGNHLTGGTTVSNCAPVNTIPDCVG